jgi:predicted DCC family thiol-disulfide oxidoreductase YuxK
MAEPAAGEHPTLVFDGDCGFCTTSARMVERRFAVPGLVVVPWQRADLDALQLTAEQCTELLQWVGADGSHASGADAIAALLLTNRAPWRWLGHLLRLPGLRWSAAVVYGWVARNRHRLPGGTPACRLDGSAK